LNIGKGINVYIIIIKYVIVLLLLMINQSLLWSTKQTNILKKSFN